MAHWMLFCGHGSVAPYLISISNFDTSAILELVYASFIKILVLADSLPKGIFFFFLSQILAFQYESLLKLLK